MLSCLVPFSNLAMGWSSIYDPGIAWSYSFALVTRTPSPNTSIGRRREKTCLRGFRLSEFQTSLLSYRDKLVNWNFACSKFTYGAFQKANNKGAEQTARMRRLVCDYAVRKSPKTGFLATRPNCEFSYRILGLNKTFCFPSSIRFNLNVVSPLSFETDSSLLFLRASLIRSTSNSAG